MGGVPGSAAQERIAQDDVRHAAMGVVGDAHGAVQPVGLTGDRLAVVERLGLHLEAYADIDRLGEVLDQLGVLGNIRVLFGRQPDIEALGHAGVGHQ